MLQCNASGGAFMLPNLFRRDRNRPKTGDQGFFIAHSFGAKPLSLKRFLQSTPVRIQFFDEKDEINHPGLGQLHTLPDILETGISLAPLGFIVM